MFGIALAITGRVQAQHGGGSGGGGNSGSSSGGRNSIPLICVHDCPALREGLSSEDDLRYFRRVMAMQATAEQRAAFAKVAQHAQTASDQLQAFRQSLQQTSKSTPLADRATALDQALEQARASNQNFLASLSDEQKTGLRDVTARLAKADFDLDKQIKAFDQIVQTPRPEPEPVANSATALNSALVSFQSEQLALAKEMSILFAPGQDVTFALPPVANSISIDGQSISIPTSGAVSRVVAHTQVPATPAENVPNLFRLKLVADLSDLQLNVASILRPHLDRAPRCGERIEVRQATLTPLAPASLLVATLHFERWVCPAGQEPMEVAGGDADLEVKLTPLIDQNTTDQNAIDENTAPGNTRLVLASEISHVEADGFLRDSLRNGDLGITLRDQITAAVLSALQKVADPKPTLPPAAQPSATIQKVQFQDDGADQLSLVLDGQLQFSDAQVQQFAAQLKQRLAAQGTTP
jgi:hypothetical protein